MTNSQLLSYMPSKKELRYLRILAEACGETFVSPHTRSESRREIKRLKGRRRLSSFDRRREDLQLSGEADAPRGDVARVREDELVGYGSTAAWSSEVRG